MAIIENDAEQVRYLCSDEVLNAEGQQADVNYTFTFNGFVLSPLLLAIQSFRANSEDTSIIEELLKNYADINFAEAKIGFSSPIMATLLNTEADSLRIIRLLSRHKFYEGQPPIVNLNAQDKMGNTALHYAAHTNKINVCRFLVEEKEVDLTLKNGDGQLAIDMASSDVIQGYLSQFQKQERKKKGSIFTRIAAVLKGKKELKQGKED
mmetsp:Transcript_4376/g.7401  ORF Transcript_4376/g.7401 Transcript_4376/m.7401 type:complete len:208 (+) Transcript_4376:452-1075(+)